MKRIYKAYILFFSFLVGNDEFNSAQYILQEDISKAPHESFIHPHYIKHTLNRNVLRNRQDNTKKSKQSMKGAYLVNASFREVVEMSYWFIKFVGQFEKQYKTHVMGKSDAELKSENKSDDHETLFSKNAASMISYARFLLKFLGSFEKLFKKLK